MKMRDPMLIMLFVLVVAACSTRYPTVPPPVRDADLYPQSETRQGLSVAVDEISDPDRVRRYFGKDLTRDNILPVLIILSNHNDDRFVVSPADVIMTEGSNVVDPLPFETVDKMAKGGLPRTANFGMQETTVQPRGRYQGLLFYALPGHDYGLYNKVQKFFTGRFRMRVVATDQETGERISFGPFSLSGF